MADERLMYAAGITGLFQEGLKDVGTPEFHAELKKVGIDLSKLLPGYPYELWERALDLTAPLFPALTPEQRHEELGRRTVLGSTSSPFLKAVLSVVGMIGTARALKRITARSGAQNTSIITFGDETKTSLVINSSYVGRMPCYGIGSFKLLTEMLGGKNVRVKILSFTFPSGSYLVEWD